MKSNNSRVICISKRPSVTEGPNYVKDKNSIKQILIIRPNACALPLVSETIFRDGNGGKLKNLKVGVQGSSATPPPPPAPTHKELFTVL